MSSCCLLIVWRQQEVAIDDHAHRKSGADRQRRLNIEIPAHDPLADLIKTLRSAPPDRLDEIVLIAASACFGPDAEKRRENRRLEERRLVIIDLVFEPGIT